MNAADLMQYQIKLASGSHDAPGKEMCIMECVAYMQGEAHTDYPKCSDDLVSYFAQRINDGSSSEDRNKLLPFVFRLAGSNGGYAIHQKRLLMLVDFVINETPRYEWISRIVNRKVVDTADFFHVYSAFFSNGVVTTTVSTGNHEMGYMLSYQEVKRALEYVHRLLQGVSAFTLGQDEYNSYVRAAVLSVTQNTSLEHTLDQSGISCIAYTSVGFEKLTGMLDRLLKLTDDRVEPIADGKEPKLRELETLTQA